MSHKHWDGKGVHVATDIPGYDRRSVEIGLLPEVANQLAILLRKNSSGLENVFTPLPDGLEELRVALDYVLVGDPASLAAHRKMDAAKGMEPSGG